MKNASTLVLTLLIGVAMFAAAAQADTSWSVPAFAGTTVGDQAIYNDTDGATWEAYSIYGYSDWDTYFSTNDSVNYRSWETDWSNYTLMTWQSDGDDPWHTGNAWRMSSGTYWQGFPRYGQGGSSGTYDKTLFGYLNGSGGSPQNDWRAALAFKAPQVGDYDLAGTVTAQDWVLGWPLQMAVLKMDATDDSITELYSAQMSNNGTLDLGTLTELQDISLDVDDRIILTTRASVDETTYGRTVYDIAYGSDGTATPSARLSLDDVTVTVPEPATMGLLGIGGLGMLLRRRSRQA